MDLKAERGLMGYAYIHTFIYTYICINQRFSNVAIIVILFVDCVAVTIHNI